MTYAKIKETAKDEFLSLLYLYFAGLSVFLIYTQFFGLQNREILTTNDGLHCILAWISDTLNAKGEIAPFKQGGVYLRGQWGIPLFFRLCSSLGFELQNILNAQVIFIHVFLSYLFFLTAKTQSFLKNIPLLLASILLGSFFPLYFYRIHYGHFDLIPPALIFLLLSLYRQWKKNSQTLGLIDKTLVLFVLLSIPFTIGGAQIIYYALIFLFYSSLFLIFRDRKAFMAFFSLPRSKRFWVAATVLLFTSVLLLYSYPILLFSKRGHFFRSTELDLLFSYVTTTPQDILSWLFVTTEENISKRNPFFLHETNIPIILPLILFCIVEKKRKWAALVAGVILLITLFTMNIPWLSSLIKILSPKIEMFRVPQRMFLLFYPLIVIPLLKEFADFLNQGFDKKKLPLYLPFLLILVVPFLSEELPWMNFLLIVTILLTLISKSYFPLKKLFPSMAVTAIILLSFCGLYGSRARATPYKNVDREIQRYKDLGNFARQKFPELSHPLNRVTLDLVAKDLPYSLASLAQLHTLDGYHHTSRRFSELMALIDERLYPKGSFQFLVMSSTPHYDYLSQIFNLKYKIFLNEKGELQILPNHEGAMLRVPKNLVYCENMEKCLRELRFNPEVAYIEEKGTNLEQKDCKVSWETNKEGSRLTLKSQAKKNCFVTIPHEALLYMDINPSIKFTPANIVNAGLWLAPQETKTVSLY